MDKDITDGIIINSKALINAIDKVIYTIYKMRVVYVIDMVNPNIFRSIGFIFENNSFFITATDNYRLALCDLKLPNSLNGRFGITKNAMLSLKRIFNFSKDILFNIAEEGNHKIAVFKSDNMVFTTKIIQESAYPDILSIINEDKEHLIIELKLSKEKKDDILVILKSFVDTAEEYKKDPVKSDFISKFHGVIIKLTLENNNLHILSSFDDSEANVSVNYKGDKYVITLNALQLLEALENMCGAGVIVKFPSKVEYGVYIKPVGNCNCLSLVMPMDVIIQ